MTEPPSATVTLLFTDIEGSTRLIQRLGERYPAVLEEHRRLLRAAFAAYGGQEVDTPGDGFFVVFGRAVDGVAAAVDGQRALATYSWPEDGAVRVRMGLHTGEPARAGGSYVGLDVHRAARLCAAGHGGQLLLSQTTLDLVERELPANVTPRNLGEHYLKDLARAERVTQLVIAGLPAEFPPLRGLDSRPNNLPRQRTVLVGREAQVAAVVELLLREDTTLVTLTGPGGTGKTRLALQVAVEALDAFPDGAFFVDLAPIADPELVLPAIAQTLGLRDASGRPPAETLVDYLRQKQLLLVLDNFEQVAPAGPGVGALLARCPGVKALATSRATLRLYGEKEYPVPPLGHPDPLRLPSVDELRRYPAVALFEQRVRDVKPDFLVSEETATAVAEICLRLDGLPLAIELAAARTRLLPPRALLERLASASGQAGGATGRSSLHLLTGGARDLPARQQTLRRTIGWSYDLLNARDQAIFRRSAVFVGGFTLDAAEAVVDSDVFDGLASLVENNLLQQRETPGGEVRFLMPETTREFGQERLEASGEAKPLRRRYAEHFLALAEQGAPELAGRQQGRWLERLEREHDNLRAALDWALQGGHAELGLRLAGALGRFWEVRGFLSEGQRWLDRVLALGASDQQPPSAGARSAALNAAGTLAYVRNDYERAATLLQDSLTLRRELGDRSGIATSLHSLSRVRFYQGDHQRAVALCEESLALRRELGDRHGIAMSLNILGVIARNRGDQTAARTLLEESLGLFRELGDQWGIGLLLNNLARVARDLGDWTWMADLCAESLTLFREVGDRHGIAWVLSNLAIVARFRGRWERAARMFGAAEALRESVGSSSLSLSPAERGAYETAVTAVRAELDPDVYTAAWADGRALPLDQAIAYALAPAEPGLAPDPATRALQGVRGKRGQTEG